MNPPRDDCGLSKPLSRLFENSDQERAKMKKNTVIIAILTIYRLVHPKPKYRTRKLDSPERSGEARYVVNISKMREIDSSARTVM